MDQLQHDFQAAITELQAQIQQQNAKIIVLQSREVRPVQKPKPSLPDPEKFNGQPYKFDTWLPSIKAKLRIDSTAIGDAVAQFYYVYLNLDSQVQAMVLPQLAQAEDQKSWDYNTILDQLTRVYDNPNKVQEAEDKLLSLKQGSEPITAYIAKFERILYEARGQDWPDVNKISTFRNGLQPSLRNRLSQQLNLPRKYSEFIRIVQQLAGRYTTFQSDHNALKHQNHQSDLMDVGAINTVNINALHASSSAFKDIRVIEEEDVYSNDST